MVNIIPQPVEVQEKAGVFRLDSETRILYHSELKDIITHLVTMLRTSTGYNLETHVFQKEEANSILIFLDSKTNNLQKGGYHLEISSENIIIRSGSSNGIFHGIQSLRQLFPKEIEVKEKNLGIDWKVNCLIIIDYPCFAWRGFMFDEGRHFHGIKVVKRLLDLLALYKLNKFHWHLTDDQGWRIEIENYPELVKIGSKRKGTQTGGIKSFLTKQSTSDTHEGYYTKEEIIEIVHYAKNLFIDVIPELDIPGHSMAAIASYPKYSCTDGPFEVATTWGIKKDVLCPGKEGTFDFIQNILLEIMELFPYRVLHIGGGQIPLNEFSGLKLEQPHEITKKSL